MMILISRAALNQIKTLKPINPKIRVRVLGGGCSGLKYSMDFTNEEPGVKDKVFVQDGVSIIIDVKSYLYLMGSTLDYEGGLNGKGFSFSNPNAKKSCGCGESFSV